MLANMKVMETPVILEKLEPVFAYIDGEFLYRDKATDQIIPNDVMEKYNKHFGIHGYDEDNRDEYEECGDE